MTTKDDYLIAGNKTLKNYEKSFGISEKCCIFAYGFGDESNAPGRFPDKTKVMKQKITMELIAKAFDVKTFEITYCKNGVIGKCQGTDRMVEIFRKNGIEIISIA